MKNIVKYSFLLAALLLCLHAESQVRLPRLISDGLVLQRETELKIWGWASADENVRVQFNGNTHTAVANEEGRWEVSLAPMKAGGPYEMEIQGSNQLKVKDILIGDVWLASGQMQKKKATR